MATPGDLGMSEADGCVITGSYEAPTRRRASAGRAVVKREATGRVTPTGTAPPPPRRRSLALCTGRSSVAPPPALNNTSIRTPVSASPSTLQTTMYEPRVAPTPGTEQLPARSSVALAPHPSAVSPPPPPPPLPSAATAPKVDGQRVPLAPPSFPSTVPSAMSGGDSFGAYSRPAPTPQAMGPSRSHANSQPVPMQVDMESSLAPNVLRFLKRHAAPYEAGMLFAASSMQDIDPTRIGMSTSLQPGVHADFPGGSAHSGVHAAMSAPGAGVPFRRSGVQGGIRGVPSMCNMGGGAQIAESAAAQSSMNSRSNGSVGTGTPGAAATMGMEGADHGFGAHGGVSVGTPRFSHNPTLNPALFGSTPPQSFEYSSPARGGSDITTRSGYGPRRSPSMRGAARQALRHAMAVPSSPSSSGSSSSTLLSLDCERSSTCTRVHDMNPLFTSEGVAFDQPRAICEAFLSPTGCTDAQCQRAHNVNHKAQFEPKKNVDVCLDFLRRAQRARDKDTEKFLTNVPICPRYSHESPASCPFLTCDLLHPSNNHAQNPSSLVYVCLKHLERMYKCIMWRGAQCKPGCGSRAAPVCCYHLNAFCVCTATYSLAKAVS